MNRTWLVAEDDPVIRSMLKMMLTLWEVDALVFESGYQVWRWLDSVEQGRYSGCMPEVALVDIKMPGHMGHEVGKRMRATAATSRIPLILMTAYLLSKDERADIMNAARPEHLLLKPFPSLDEFRDLIEQTIQSSRVKPKRVPGVVKI